METMIPFFNVIYKSIGEFPNGVNPLPALIPDQANLEANYSSPLYIQPCTMLVSFINKEADGRVSPFQILGKHTALPRVS